MMDDLYPHDVEGLLKDLFGTGFFSSQPYVAESAPAF